MARQAESLLQLLECHICSEIFDEASRKPKVLPCQHTFCLACMKKLGHHDFRQNGGSGPVILRLVLKCPECSVEYDVPENDVETYPNNITMIGFLSVAPPLQQNYIHSKPKSITSPQNDIKGCLEERVELLRIRIAEAKIDYAMRVSEWEKEVDDAKKLIRSNCTQFKEAIDRREKALIDKLEECSSKRVEAYQKHNAPWNAKLADMEDFCNQMEHDLRSALTDRRVAQNLDQCLGFMETLESSGDNGSGDGCNADHDAAKWKVNFSPDRKDTVHASIAMYGELHVMNPHTMKAAARKTVHERPLIRRVYTREFLLKLQPQCRYLMPPPLLTQISEISGPDKAMTTQQMLEFNKLMLQQKPMMLNLLNDRRQSVTVPTVSLRPRSNRSLIPEKPCAEDRDQSTFGDSSVSSLPHRIHEPADLSAFRTYEDWSPPRLYLGQAKPPVDENDLYLDDC